jgi:hypothetical protein
MNFIKSKYFTYSCLIILGIVIALLFKCEGKKPNQTNTIGLKQQIKTVTVKKDSIQKVIVREEVIRYKTITKYIHDKGLDLPCDTVLNLVIADCDTIIKVDSILISSLKKELKYDSLIITWHQKIQAQDSVEILALKKEVKKERRKKKFFQLTTILCLGAAIVK